MMMKIDYNRANKEFQSYYQKTINVFKSGHPQYAEIDDNVIIRIQFDVVWGKIPKSERIYEFEKMTEYQKSVFYKALIQQIYYVLTEGDFTSMSGYDVAANTFLSPEIMERVALSNAARKTLKDGGLLYNGVNGNAVCSPYPRRGWR